MKEVESKYRTNLYFLDFCLLSVVGIIVIVGIKGLELLEIIPSPGQISDSSFEQAFLLEIIYSSIGIIPMLILVHVLSTKNNKKEAAILNSTQPNPVLVLLADREKKTVEEINEAISELGNEEKEILFSQHGFTDDLEILRYLSQLRFIDMQQVTFNKEKEQTIHTQCWITDKGSQFLAKQLFKSQPNL